MGGRSKNFCSVEVAVVVDLSLDDVDTDEMDRSDLFHELPDNDESDDENDPQCPDAEINVIIQEEWLTEVVKGCGHQIIFFPKFHCELNFIEMVWGWMKSYHRRHCTYNYNSLKSGLPSTMLSEMPIAFVRRAARHCYRFMSGYRQGLDGPLLDYTMKKYSGHRRIPDDIMVEVQAAFDESHNVLTNL